MKNLIIRTLALSAALSGVVAQGALSTIAFSSVGPFAPNDGTTGAALTFYAGGTGGNSGTFGFGPSTVPAFGPYQWVESGSGAYLGSFIGQPANDALGNPIPDGTFAYSGVTSTGLHTWSANVTTSGSVQVIDVGAYALSGKFLTGTLNWNTISTTYQAGGVTGSIAIEIAPGADYTGTDQTLLNLAKYGGTVDISFTFDQNNHSLRDLALNGGTASTWDGQITIVPETSSVVAGFAAFGLVVLMIARRPRTLQAK